MQSFFWLFNNDEHWNIVWIIKGIHKISCWDLKALQQFNDSLILSVKVLKEKLFDLFALSLDLIAWWVTQRIRASTTSFTCNPKISIVSNSIFFLLTTLWIIGSWLIERSLYNRENSNQCQREVLPLFFRNKFTCIRLSHT